LKQTRNQYIRRAPKWNNSSILFNTRLQEAVQKYGFDNIDKIQSEYFPMFDSLTLSKKVSRLNPNLKRGKWSIDEDILILKSFLDNPGPSRNTLETAKLLKRSYDSVYSRGNILKMAIKTRFFDLKDKKPITETDVSLELLDLLQKAKIENKPLTLFDRRDSVYQQKLENGIKKYGLNPLLIKKFELPEWPQTTIKLDLQKYTPLPPLEILDAKQELIILQHVMKHGIFQWNTLVPILDKGIAWIETKWSRISDRLSLDQKPQTSSKTQTKLINEINSLINQISDYENSNPKFTKKHENLLILTLKLFDKDLETIQKRFFPRFSKEFLLKEANKY
jgi:hypothetical protein